MAKKQVFLGLILSMCFTVGISAQDTTQGAAEQPAKVQEKDKGKKAKGQDKRQQRWVDTISKSFAKAKLTKEQQEKVSELVDTHWDDLSSTQKELNGMVPKGDRKKKNEAVKKAKKDGKSGADALTAGWEAIGLSKEDQAKIKELNTKRNDMIAEIKDEIRGSLTADQKKAMGGKKGKRKKKKDADSLTSVSVKLPGMT